MEASLLLAFSWESVPSKLRRVFGKKGWNLRSTTARHGFVDGVLGVHTAPVVRGVMETKMKIPRITPPMKRWLFAFLAATQIHSSRVLSF